MSSGISRDMNVSADYVRPDLFQFYIQGVAELLSGDDFSPFSCRVVGTTNGSFRDKELLPKKEEEEGGCDEKTDFVGFGSLFRNAAGDGLSGFKKAKLLAMLRQSVVALTREVDEMLDPVFSMHRLRGLMAPTKSSARYQDPNSKDENESRALKRLKVPSSSSSINEPLIVSPVSCNLTGEGSQNERKGVVAKPGKSLTGCSTIGCAKFSKTDMYPEKSNLDEPKFVCDDCLKQAKGSLNYMDVNESFFGSSSRDDKGNGEVNDDLQVLLVNRGPKVEEKMEKHSAELSATLDRMQEKLEELLDIVISSCRPMTLAEKLQLRRLIENLPTKNLDRVVEIIQLGKRSGSQSSDHMTVDLQHEENAVKVQNKHQNCTMKTL
ncbi:uncharacterized protein LOC112513749 isoform X2 [Cynara cardunculus var. scolymus]|uniref:uncharacterized protein LOC112513749 isoform X2 n=1 Tax=Cynara cardunculus var. scolymus TaxID=59895 RepID=UPI000D62EDBE|nr:uncharacterized protein LOC112513749 isoform X2 [Cynara cardunculus var. scolymus]